MLLYLGAETLVRGASNIALRFGVGPLVVGLTVVAFGTSSPELAVSLKEALAGAGDIAVGNVVGSNVCNIALILGLSALIRPITIQAQPIRLDVPILVACSLLLYVLGAVTANVLGRRLVHLGEAVVDRIPFVKAIYQATKNVVGTMSGGGKRAFRQVVLVPFPASDTRSVGFVTKEFRDRDTGEPMYAVFMATAPNPTTGFVLVLKQSDVVKLDWSVELAVKAVMSGGVLMPDTVPALVVQKGPVIQTGDANDT